MLRGAMVAGLVSGLAATEPGLRLRCAIALERMTRSHAELLHPHTSDVLAAVLDDRHPDVQWELARLLPRLDLDPSERRRVLVLLERLLDRSPVAVVRASALEAVVELARDHPEHEALASRCLDRASHSSSASVQARSRRLGHS
ncbi:MAG TPA: HEAT repeat domain-containing protein [Nocardioides sp.]|uniref:HEAT repeat domain-containing protein n=1 Tax=Nocardioides sp. TaxID=35761 RepID=UPI002E380C0E|nr:HEAT repeat domain-containing protein [Nocardioides sp.]HEX5086384.1 HEAT repeat domain-containing protein [Nocardioides sp.]